MAMACLLRCRSCLLSLVRTCSPRISMPLPALWHDSSSTCAFKAIRKAAMLSKTGNFSSPLISSGNVIALLAPVQTRGRGTWRLRGQLTGHDGNV